MNAPFAPSAVTAATAAAYRPKKLNERFVEVELHTSRARLSRRDAAAEAFVQTELGDASLTTYSRLFKDPASPINRLMNTVNAVYNYHVANTWPKPEKGRRLLFMPLHEEYRREMNRLMDEAYKTTRALMPNYDAYVQMDINARSQSAIARGQPVRACIDDYPTAEEFEQRLRFELRLTPLPDKSHFMFDLDDDDLAAFENSLKEVETAVRSAAVKSMMEPLQKLIDKISVPLEKGKQRFHDCIVENVVESIEVFKKISGEEDPAVLAMVAKMDTEVKRYSIDWLKESPVMREQASKNLKDIADQMAAFM